MGKLKCAECSAIFAEYEIKSDALLCPSCGGRLEEISRNEDTRGNRQDYSNQQQQSRTQKPSSRKINTHYDNLKVARNAPYEVIRAAYRTLSQKYHPDLNRSNPDAAKIMKIINAAYEVLSDPEKRQAHDLWIAQQEAASTETDTSNRQSYQKPYASSPPNIPTVKISSSASGILRHIGKNFLWYAFAGFMLWSLTTGKSSSPRPDTKPYQAAPAGPIKQSYVRPATAPNGKPWPTSASYLSGYQRHHTNGLSKVTVDNSQNDSDVFVKLVSTDGAKAYPVRTFYIPGHGTFTLNKVSAGNYDIRYRDLESGSLSRSEPFQLEENRTETGTQFSNLKMTLYKVKNGNMQTYGLAEEEF